MFKKVLPYLILLVCLLPLIWPLVQPGFFVTDDGDAMIVRLSAFNQTLKTGQFPVRFLERLNHGYGYPVLDFLYPLPFYFGELIHLTFHLSFIDTVKALFALNVFLGACAMFLLVSSNLGALPGLLAALCYSYFPYRVINLYKRGSLGEETAFVFLPLTVHFLLKLFKSQSFRDLVLGSLCLAGLIMAHNTLAFIFLPILLFLGLTKIFESKAKILNRLFLSMIFFALGFALSAFYWLPAIFDLNFTRAGKIEVAEFQHYFIRYDNPALNDSFLHQVGPILPIILLIGLLMFLLYRTKILAKVLLIGLIGIFFASSSSEFFWKTFPLPRLVQFPLRFLFLSTISGSILIGAITKKWRWLGIVITLMTIFWGISLIKINKVFYPETYYTLNDGTTTIKNEYLPIWVKNEFLQKPPSDLIILSGNGQVLSSNKVTSVTEVKLRINRVYFPGWNVFVDGKSTAIDYQKDGFLDVTVPSGTQMINYVFQETPVRLFADIISIASIIVALVLLFK